MLGAIVLSEYNEIVHIFGNSKFHKNIEKSINGKAELVPSTSGISSSSSNNSLNSKENNQHMINPNKMTSISMTKKKDLNKTALIEKLFPLIILHRTSQLENQIDTIKAEHLMLKIMDFSNAYFIVFCFEEKSEEFLDMFVDTILRNLNYHYGAYMELLLNGGLAKVHSRMERRMERLMLNYDKPKVYNDCFNINLNFGNAAKVQPLMPLFREINSKISMTINKNCRCIFLNSGKLIGATSSQSQFVFNESQNFFQLINQENLIALLESCLTPADNNGNTGPAINIKRCLKCQVEQAWLYSNQLKKEQLYNVFVFSLTGEIELICITNADHSLLISTISNLLKELEQIGQITTNRIKIRSTIKEDKQFSKLKQCVNDANLLRQKVEDTAQIVQKLTLFITNLTLNKFQNEEFVFLTNIERTKKLILNLWKRYCAELLQFQNMDLETESLDNHSSSVLYNSSVLSRINRISSTLSLFSSNSTPGGNESTIFSSNYNTWHSTQSTAYSANRRHRVSTAHLEGLRTQLRRLLRNVLNEIVNHSYMLAKIGSLERMHSTVREVIDRQASTSMSLMLNSVVRTWNNGNPLRPRNLGLDMLAFQFERNDSPLNYYYIPEKYRQIFTRQGILPYESDFIIARSSSGLLILQISTSIKKNWLKPNFNFKKMPYTKTKNQTSEIRGNCLTVFESYVNVSLAMKQAHQLINTLNNELDFAIKNFC